MLALSSNLSLGSSENPKMKIACAQERSKDGLSTVPGRLQLLWVCPIGPLTFTRRVGKPKALCIPPCYTIPSFTCIYGRWAIAPPFSWYYHYSKLAHVVISSVLLLILTFIVFHEYTLHRCKLSCWRRHLCIFSVVYRLVSGLVMFLIFI